MSQKSDASTILLYGVTGYSGALISKVAAGRRIRHLAAGRDAKKVAAHAGPLGLPTRVFGLDSQAAIESALRGVRVVLNCAGPFAGTAPPLAKACAKLGVHYLDLAGQWPEIDATASLDEAARGSGALLMPGVGFSIVPTDCMAVRVARRLREQGKEPIHIDLAFQVLGSASRGTLGTVLKDLRSDGARLREGRKVKARPAEDTLQVDFVGQFSEDKVTAQLNPWRGDLATVERSTGVANADTWWVIPAPLAWMMRTRSPMSNLALGTFRKLLPLLPAGPSEKSVAKSSTRVWARARARDGSEACSVLKGPEAYRFTAATAIESARRAAAGDVPAGFHTPAEIWGAEYIEEFDGVEVFDIESDVP